MMDIFQDYTPHFLTLYQHLNPYIRSVNSLILSIESKLMPYLLLILNRIAVFAQDSPAIISVSLLILLLLVSMQILNFARRMIVFWTRIMLQVLFYGGIALLLMVVWQRGVGRTVGDLAEWALEIRDVWWREYRRWEGYQNQGRARSAASGRYSVRGGNAGTAWR